MAKRDPATLETRLIIPTRMSMRCGKSKSICFFTGACVWSIGRRRTIR